MNRTASRRPNPLLRTTLAICTIAAGLLSTAVCAQDRVLAAAQVNDDVISNVELQQRTRFAMVSARIADTADSRQRVQRQILSQMIDERLQLQDARRNAITVTDVEIRERISQIEAANGMAPGQLRGAVEGTGLPFRMLEEQIKANIAWIKTVRRRIVPQIEVSEAEIVDAMRRLKVNVGKQETRVSEIFMAVDRAGQDDEVRRNAERVLGQLRAGASFAAMAQQFSQSATAAVGGDIGWVLPGALDPKIEGAIDKLQPRQISDPIRTAAGWHIVGVVDRRPVGRASNPDEVRVHVVQMIIPLPENATVQEAERQSGEARKAMALVKNCRDLRTAATKTMGATANDIESLRVGEMPQHMRDPLLNAAVGTAIGPFRVGKPSPGVQVLAICGRQGSDGLPSREAIVQNIRSQKIEAVARRYMRDLRRNASIEVR